MYGKWVTVELGEDVQCKVYVACIPSTPPEDILQRTALSILKSRLPEKKTGILAAGDALTAISDYEYSQGYGARYEMEKRLNMLLSEDNEQK